MKQVVLVLIGILCWLGNSPLVSGQSKIISGQVVDVLTGAELLGATLYWKDQPSTAVVSDDQGRFSLPSIPAVDSLELSYIGYQKQIIYVPAHSSSELLIRMIPSAQGLAEFVVEGKSQFVHSQSTDLGRNIIDVERLKSLPSLFGEVDVLRSLQLLPGIQTAGEGTTGLFVRGGAADQNLIQLDGAPVYNPSHFFGFFSVFNPDALEQVDLYKGNIPATFGGRASSVVDITMKEGRPDRLHAAGGIGNISSKITLDGPLFSEKSSFLLTGRRTYADLFLKLSNDASINSNKLYFYDLGAKFTFRPSDRDKLSFSTYFGSDYLQAGNLFGFGWKNWVGSADWKRTLRPDLYLDLNAYSSRYRYQVEVMDNDNGFLWNNLLSESGVKTTLSYILNSANTFEVGMKSQLFHFRPVEMSTQPGSSLVPVETNPGNALLQSFFVSGESELGTKLKLETGLRWSLFARVGQGLEYQYEDSVYPSSQTITDTLYFSRLQLMKFYQGLEPRIAMRYSISPSLSLKASYNRNYQYTQVATNSSAGLPIDRWVLSGEYIRPLQADQFSAGLFKDIKGGIWEMSVETYYKKYQHLIDVRQGGEVLFSDQIEAEVFEGKGWSYGAELLLRKNTGRTTGWLGYTYSRTFRQVAGISLGQPYAPRYDRPHDVSLVLQHDFSKRLSGNATFVYATGQAVSYPVGSYVVDFQQLPLYPEERNEDRFPDYHRMDVSVTLKDKEKGKRWKGSWSLSVYNIYGRKNPYSYQFTDIINNDINFTSSSGDPIYSKRPGVVMTYLFTFLPSISYNFEF